jgi:hypothetical protein
MAPKGPFRFLYTDYFCFVREFLIIFSKRLAKGDRKLVF